MGGRTDPCTHDVSVTTDPYEHLSKSRPCATRMAFRLFDTTV